MTSSACRLDIECNVVVWRFVPATSGTAAPQVTTICNICSVDALEGPSRISDGRQVALPKRLMDGLGWDKGDYVMFRLSDDDPEVMTVVLESVVLRQLRAGEEAERAARTADEEEEG